MSPLRKDINELLKHDELTIGEILEILKEESYGILFLILSLPSAMFFPAPGVSTIFAVVMILLGFRMIQEKPPWIPEKYKDKKLKKKTIKRMDKVLSIYLNILEKFTKPRFNRYVTERNIGFLITLMSFNMFIPFPLTNSAPALSIFLLSFSLINKDGLITLIGVFIGVLGFFITVLSITFGVMGIEFGYNELKTLIEGVLIG